MLNLIEQEPYAKDESVDEEPGDDEADSKIDSDGEMRLVRCGSVAPDRVHVRVRTRISQ